MHTFILRLPSSLHKGIKQLAERRRVHEPDHHHGRGRETVRTDD
jgi:hypothetical protein